jgi:2-dehydro-3-deoxyphosphogluconate aldolase/(4S)-4-hydroxy-2-oxoglutarate aldolase
MNNSIEVIGNLGIVPVVKISDIKFADGLANSLLNSGLNTIEITLRTEQALKVINKLSSKYSDLLVGAGTVLHLDDAKKCVDNGAKFIVSPGFSTSVVDWCIDNEVQVMPGIATPTEIMHALDRKLKILKIFPVEALGGTKYLKALGDVFKDIRFIPTGGINVDNLASYIQLPYVHACGGSWIASSKAIENEDYEGIEKRASEALANIASVRKGDLQ